MIRGKWSCLVLLGISFAASAGEITCRDGQNNELSVDMSSDLVSVTGDEISLEHQLEILASSPEKILAASPDGFVKMRINLRDHTILFNDYKADKRLFYSDCR